MILAFLEVKVGLAVFTGQDLFHIKVLCITAVDFYIRSAGSRVKLCYLIEQPVSAILFCVGLILVRLWNRTVNIGSST